MGFSLREAIAASFLSGAIMNGSAAIANENAPSPLTERQEIAVNLVREYSRCVEQEDTTMRAMSISTYDRTLERIKFEYNQNYFAWSKQMDSYYAQLSRVADENNIEFVDRNHRYIQEVPPNTPELLAALEYADRAANLQKIKNILEAETGLTEPVEPSYKEKEDKIRALGKRPLDPVTFCSNRISDSFSDAGIDVGWDLEEILKDIIEDHGPEVYEALIEP